MASRGKAQLADNSNEVMAAAFKTIFKVDKSDAATVQTVSSKTTISMYVKLD